MHRRRHLAVLMALAAALALSATTAADGAVTAPAAPSSAVRVAVRVAQAHFRTTNVHATFSLRSRINPRWALVDGHATSRARLWAAWVHADARGRWQLRYFDTTAPFQPQSTTHGRVPCDLYPAFSEPRCPAPGTPTVAQIRAGLFDQLAPSGSAARIGAILKKGGYTFAFKPLMTGTVVITWYRPAPRAGMKPTIIARGSAELSDHRAKRMTVTLTGAGRRLLQGAVRVTLKSKGTFTPILYAAVSATRAFTLIR
ncbi:MAG TPA: hypothetical protein VE127_05550 [Solirubrobacteraceae bacterium]|nr:hypothetical protein [Solirubrobacteraceae bacterium]